MHKKTRGEYPGFLRIYWVFVDFLKGNYLCNFQFPMRTESTFIRPVPTPIHQDEVVGCNLNYLAINLQNK